MKPLYEVLREAEREYLLEALADAGGDIHVMAQRAGISKSSAFRKVKAHRCKVPARALARLIRIPPKACKAITLLRFFGVELPPGKQRSFWLNASCQLDVLHRDAHRNWQAMQRKLHPDNGGDGARLALVNEAWNRLEKVLRKHGVEC